MNLKSLFDLLRETFTEWNEDKAPTYAAALAYFTAFSIAPLLVIVIAIVGAIFDEGAARQQIVTSVGEIAGEGGVELINGLLDSASQPTTGLIATVISIVTLLAGATGVFGQLQDALNTMWDVKREQVGIVQTIKDKFLSFTLVLGVGFLLLVSLVLSTVIAAVTNFISGMFPAVQILTQGLHFLLSFGIITLLFAMIYKVLPDAKIAWGDVWLGAGVTALLFTIGKFLLGLYLGQTSFTSTYGAAGSLIVMLVWVFYSAQILFFGAEFTQVYARRHGSWKADDASKTVEPDPIPKSSITGESLHQPMA
ncbi:MAG: YihY/virulence factor BrkB family protein [Anaerolineae bacterium]|jgi:membrane protein|nr:YihY/virulence factor BrkB family protein [Anaerolineae bacterium]